MKHFQAIPTMAPVLIILDLLVKLDQIWPGHPFCVVLLGEAGHLPTSMGEGSYTDLNPPSLHTYLYRGGERFDGVIPGDLWNDSHFSHLPGQERVWLAQMLTLENTKAFLVHCT